MIKTQDDTGYLENEPMQLLKQALVSVHIRCPILKCLEKENFQTFNINVFKDEAFENEPQHQGKYEGNSRYAEGFVITSMKIMGEKSLFYGTTGLGRPFM